jgi:hypothetical protein
LQALFQSTQHLYKKRQGSGSVPLTNGPKTCGSGSPTLFATILGESCRVHFLYTVLFLEFKLGVIFCVLRSVEKYSFLRVPQIQQPVPGLPGPTTAAAVPRQRTVQQSGQPPGLALQQPEPGLPHLSGLR